MSNPIVRLPEPHPDAPELPAPAHYALLGTDGVTALVAPVRPDPIRPGRSGPVECGTPIKVPVSVIDRMEATQHRARVSYFEYFM